MTENSSPHPAIGSKHTSAFPILHQCIQFVAYTTAQTKSAAAWTTPKESLLFLAGWWMLCLRFWFIVIYIVPLLPLLWSAKLWSTSFMLSNHGDDKKASQSASQQGMDDVQVTRLLHSLEQALQTWSSMLLWTSHPYKTRRVFITLVYGYIFWVVAHQLAETRFILVLLGTAVFAWNSPWMKLVRTQIPYPLIRSLVVAAFVGPLQRQDDQDDLMTRALKYQIQVAKDTDDHPTDSSFTFALYENQRLWPFGQWDSQTLSFERSAWSDDIGVALPPKASFQLPSPIEVTVPDATNPNVQHKKTWEWAWLDAEWRIDTHKDVDELGWEYGTVMWTLFDRKPKMHLATRRRRWLRRAKIDYRLETLEVTRTEPNSPIVERHVEHVHHEDVATANKEQPKDSVAAASPPVTTAPVVAATTPVAAVSVPAVPVSAVPVAAAHVTAAPVATSPTTATPVTKAPVATVPVATSPVSLDDTKSTLPASKTAAAHELTASIRAALSSVSSARDQEFLPTASQPAPPSWNKPARRLSSNRVPLRLDTKPRENEKSGLESPLSPDFQDVLSSPISPKPSFSTSTLNSINVHHDDPRRWRAGHSALASSGNVNSTSIYSMATTSDEWGSSSATTERRSSAVSRETSRRKREPVWKSIVPT